MLACRTLQADWWRHPESRLNVHWGRERFAGVQDQPPALQKAARLFRPFPDWARP
jgi:hypothetical protein